MATRYSISVSEELGKQLDYFLEKNKKDFSTDSSFFQSLLNEFFNRSNKHYLSKAMLYLGYPFIILTILLKVAIQTKDITYQYISMLILGFLLAGLYLLVSKQRGRK